MERKEKREELETRIPDTLQELLSFIKQDKVCLLPLYETVCNTLSSDPGHDIGHMLRVALWTTRLYVEKDHNPTTRLLFTRHSIIVGLFHDIVNLPKNHPERSLASVKSSDLTREILKDYRSIFDEYAVDYMCNAIADHSYSSGREPYSFLGKCLQDADRLEALGVLGLFRCISVGTSLGNAMFHTLDPWCQDRTPNDKKFALDHCPVKLLKLKFHFVKSRVEAVKRINNIHSTLTKLGEEIGIDYNI
jgi:uncharacterized protein